ncbi:MAG: hypothetical protein F7C32_02190 [Desulfurococcales archaeon]|nr:hypothetical protein [Desulfurococcales archaeon]
MNNNLLVVILVAGILLVSGTIAYAYASGHGNFMAGTTNDADDNVVTYGQGGMYGCMMGDHDDDEMMGGMMWGNGPGGYGNHDDDFDMDDHMGGMMGMDMDEFNYTTITGVIVAIDPNYQILTINDGTDNVSVKIMRMYVDNQTGTLIFGPWILNNIQIGSEITVTIPDFAGYTNMMPITPAFGLDVGGNSYIFPGLYNGGMCMHNHG